MKGLFNMLLRKDTKLETAIDLSILGADMHSHLIPGIDDGVKTMEESLQLIRDFRALGYSKLVTTPHIMTDYYKNTPDIIRAGLDDLRRAVRGEGIDIVIEAAAEYMVDIGFRAKLEHGELMTFGDGYVLIELSYLYPPAELHSLVFDMRVAGYKVVLAHPERYAYWFDDPGQIEDLLGRGVLLQLNTISLSGFYANEVRKMALQLIDKGWYSFAGSDMHNQDYMRTFGAAAFEPGLEKLMASGKLLNNTI